MKIFLSAPAVLLLLIFISCNYNKKNTREKLVSIGNLDQSEPPGFKDFQTDSDNEDQKQKAPEKKLQKSSREPANTDWDKKIIKTAELNFEVKDYTNFTQSVRSKIKELGGYIAQEEQAQSGYKIENTITIKVPVDKFDDAVITLSTNADKINIKKITSEDVTSEVVDTKSRLEAKKQTRLRYLELMKQAKNMQEVLSVQNEINSIQELIESASGRINYINHASAFSTIHLSFYQVLDPTAQNPETQTFFTKLTSSFKGGWNFLGDLTVGIVSIWPLFIFGILTWLLIKRLRFVKNKQV